MDFDLSPDQEALRAAAADLLDRFASSELLRAYVGTGLPGVGDGATTGPRSDGFDRPLWEAMADQGWLDVELPEDQGGLGLGMVEVAVLCEELGRRAAPAPFVGTVLCLGALRGALAHDDLPVGTRQASEQWVARLSGAEAVGCVAWAAGPGTVTASRDGEGWRLTGRPEPTPYGSVAEVAVVVTDDALYAVPLGGEVRPTTQPAMDPTRPLAWLRMDGTPAYRLGGASPAATLVDRAATSAAALLLGTSARVLEVSVEYAKVRHQFGRPIGSFQAVKHRLADALVDVEGMRSSAYYAAWCLAADDPEAPVAASMAKAWCSDASRRVTAAGLQVHGGIGFTWEHELHLHLKRAQLDAAGCGDAGWHRDRIAGLLRQRRSEGGSPI